MKRDVNKIPVFIKELFVQTPVQFFLAFPFLRILNSIKVEGREHLKVLPRNNVLFVSNHQTYYMEGIALMTEFNRIRHPLLHWFWKSSIGHCYYIIAVETAHRKGFINRILEWAGAVTVSRTWRRGNLYLRPGEISMDQVQSDQDKVVRAIKDGWVLTFPQGTTNPGAKGRKGTAYIIKQAKCVVVPVVIDGFSKAFAIDRLCRPKKFRSKLSVKFKPPININYNDSVEVILGLVMDAIEQSEKFRILSPDSS